MFLVGQGDDQRWWAQAHRRCLIDEMPKECRFKKTSTMSIRHSPIWWFTVPSVVENRQILPLLFWHRNGGLSTTRNKFLIFASTIAFFSFLFENTFLISKNNGIRLAASQQSIMFINTGYKDPSAWKELINELVRLSSAQLKHWIDNRPLKTENFRAFFCLQVVQLEPIKRFKWRTLGLVKWLYYWGAPLSSTQFNWAIERLQLVEIYNDHAAVQTVESTLRSPHDGSLQWPNNDPPATMMPQN